MAKRKKTRRSISVKGATYRMFKVLAERRGLPVSALTEQVMLRELDGTGIVDPGAAPVAPATSTEPEAIPSAHFTF